MKLEEMFRKVKGAAFMPYVCCGDPSPEFSVSLVKTLVECGADAIELGIPFSDPIADGRAIQAASARALSGGMTPKKALGLIARLRKEGVRVPIVAMTYYNIAFSYGQRKFVRELKEAGAQGLIVPDLPPEEAGDLLGESRNAGIDLIFLITPNCSTARLKKIAGMASGFLYAVAVLGITGARKRASPMAVRLVRRAKRFSELPVAVGFGVSKPEHAAAYASAGADGVIVGSEIVDIYSKFIGDREFGKARALAEIGRFARRMKRACLAQ